jgi:cbb3-type cytochrome oxidase maturation protein
MNALLILLPIALCLGLLGLAAFLWAMRSGQFEDLDGAGSRILFDDRSVATRRHGGTHRATDLISQKGDDPWIRR